MGRVKAIGGISTARLHGLTRSAPVPMLPTVGRYIGWINYLATPVTEVTNGKDSIRRADQYVKPLIQQ